MQQAHIAKWIHVRLPSCGLRFKSQAHHYWYRVLPILSNTFLRTWKERVTEAE